MQIAYITPHPPTTSPNLLDDPEQNALGGSYQMIPQTLGQLSREIKNIVLVWLHWKSMTKYFMVD